MKLERILRCVMSEPWLITPQSHANIRQLLDWKLKLSHEDFVAKKRTGEDVSGGAVDLPSMQIVDGVACIPFAGVLLKGADGIERAGGALSHDDVVADINEAIENPEVKALMFDVDSPGGTAAGSFELADLVAAAADNKPTMAWVERLCCSAAFLSMSGCGMIYGSKTSEIGAVECYMAWIDSCLAFEREGLKTKIIKNTGGTHVGAGLQGIPLSKEQEMELQSQVDQLFQLYVSHLEEVRPQITRSAMDGRTFIGAKGVQVGMFDAITTKQQAFQDLKQWAGVV